MNLRRMMYVSLLLNALLLISMGVLCIRYHWVDKLAQRMGLKEVPRSQDYLTTMSWNHTMESLSYEADVVLFGASLTSDGQWQERFDSLKICNLGKSGDRLSTMLWRVPQITAVHPQKIFLSMEQNDMHDMSVEEIERAYVVLVDSILTAIPKATLFLESLTPLNELQYKRVCNNEKIREVNEVIKKTAIERGVTYIDIYTIYEEEGQLPMTLSYDGQHLKQEAYDRWAEVLKTYIEE